MNRACKVEAVHDTEGLSAHAGEICRVFIHGVRCTVGGRQEDLAGVAPAGEGKPVLFSIEPEYGSIAVKSNGPELYIMVILLHHPVFPGYFRVRKHPENQVFQGTLRAREWFFPGVSSCLPEAFGRISAQERDRDICNPLTMEHHHVPGIGDDFPDIAPPEVILLCNPPHQGDICRANLDEHPFLRLGKHDLDGPHIRLTLVDPVSMDQATERAAHLARCTGKPCCTEVPAGDHLPGLRHLEDRLDQEFLGERVPDLDARAVLCLGILRKVPGSKRGPAKPVAAC
ncbi:hypothetical protein ASZ90_017026 [hydrocarbon metagenome]|uniref:Uncharacterized protein n=1 Tax=hydrocarbon metagenome TaxID=938273 RepID=A0A0W8EAT3_9ZZZZ